MFNKGNSSKGSLNWKFVLPLLILAVIGATVAAFAYFGFSNSSFGPPPEPDPHVYAFEKCVFNKSVPITCLDFDLFQYQTDERARLKLVLINSDQKDVIIKNVSATSDSFEGICTTGNIDARFRSGARVLFNLNKNESAFASGSSYADLYADYVASSAYASFSASAHDYASAVVVSRTVAAANEDDATPDSVADAVSDAADSVVEYVASIPNAGYAYNRDSLTDHITDAVSDAVSADGATADSVSEAVFAAVDTGTHTPPFLYVPADSHFNSPDYSTGAAASSLVGSVSEAVSSAASADDATADSVAEAAIDAANGHAADARAAADDSARAAFRAADVAAASYVAYAVNADAYAAIAAETAYHDDFVNLFAPASEALYLALHAKGVTDTSIEPFYHAANVATVAAASDIIPDEAAEYRSGYDSLDDYSGDPSSYSEDPYADYYAAAYAGASDVISASYSAYSDSGTSDYVAATLAASDAAYAAASTADYSTDYPNEPAHAVIASYASVLSAFVAAGIAAGAHDNASPEDYAAYAVYARDAVTSDHAHASALDSAADAATVDYVAAVITAAATAASDPAGATADSVARAVNVAANAAVADAAAIAKAAADRQLNSACVFNRTNRIEFHSINITVTYSWADDPDTEHSARGELLTRA